MESQQVEVGISPDEASVLAVLNSGHLTWDEKAILENFAVRSVNCAPEKLREILEELFRKEFIHCFFDSEEMTFPIYHVLPLGQKHLQLFPGREPLAQSA